MMSPGKPDVDPNSSSEQDISETSTLTGTQDIYEPVPVPPKIRGARTNYLRVCKLGVPICGHYFIDTSIPPVPKTVPCVVAGTENLFLHTTSGPITANVWLTGNNKLKRVSMKLSTEKGDIQAKVHEAFSASESECRPYLDIELWAHIGSVYLSLPRCFRGLITIQPSTHRDHLENITLSPALEERAAPLSDVKGARAYFVGGRPHAWMSCCDDNDQIGLGEKATAGAGRSPEEPFDKITVSHRTFALCIRWDGELEPKFPE